MQPVISFFILLKNFIHGFHILLEDKQFKGLLFLVALILLIGTLFYAHFEKWSILNSVYFCIVTLTTVGYGDLTPHNDIGKVFTMFYIIIGIGIFLGFINVVARHATKQYRHQGDIYLGHTESIVEHIIDRIMEKQNK